MTRINVLEEAKKHKCFGKNNCWNNVRAKCLVSDYCKIIANKPAYASTQKKDRGVKE